MVHGLARGYGRRTRTCLSTAATVQADESNLEYHWLSPHFRDPPLSHSATCAGQRSTPAPTSGVAVADTGEHFKEEARLICTAVSRFTFRSSLPPSV